MPTFANQFKGEVSRLAKKEVKAETQALKNALAAHRGEIVALKRRLAELEARVNKMSKGMSHSKTLELTEEDSGAGLRFRATGFAALRKKLGISAAEMGKLLDVSAQSVYHWETGKTKPRARQLEAISVVRKMDKREVTAKLNNPSDQ